MNDTNVGENFIGHPKTCVCIECALARSESQNVERRLALKDLALVAWEAAHSFQCVGTDSNNDTCGVTFTCGPCRMVGRLQDALHKAEALL